MKLELSPLRLALFCQLVLVVVGTQDGCQRNASTFSDTGGSVLFQKHRSHITNASQVGTSHPRVVTEAERNFEEQCSFMNENGRPAVCRIESPEHYLVREHLLPESTVLEFGARYGTTSCEIAAKQANSGKLVSIEPDNTVWDVFEKNMMSHGCNTNLLKGLVGNGAPAPSSGEGYAKKFRFHGSPHKADVSATTSPKVYTFTEVEARYNLKFDTLLVDCEGCFLQFLDDDIDALNGIHTVLLEADMGTVPKQGDPRWGVDYDVVVDRLQQAGFDIVEQFQGKDGTGIAKHMEGQCCGDMWHFAFKRRGTIKS